ncbi:hypothetical protein KIW84_063921 [Lathyrus oleraceus]|uniref:Uncharacterized protein n=1 Tax=Pisum sativum TaxID=3888 RepID=A0A9D4WA73_PEA|nr:hypothetical protein KIW84_063921 [Pisum sativum]
MIPSFTSSIAHVRFTSTNLQNQPSHNHALAHCHEIQAEESHMFKEVNSHSQLNLRSKPTKIHYDNQENIQPQAAVAVAATTKLSTSRSTCRGKWARIGLIASFTDIDRSSCTDLDSFSYDESLVPSSGNSDSKLIQSFCDSLPFRRLDSPSFVSCSKDFQVNTKSGGQVDTKGNDETVLAAARTLCEIKTRIKTKKASKVDKEISTVKKQLPSSGGHSSLSWGLQKQLPSVEFNMKSGHSETFVSAPSGLPKNSNSLAARMRNQSSMPHSTIGSAKVMGQQQFDSEGAESPSEQSPLQQQSPSVPVTTHHAPSVRNLAEQDCQQTLKTFQHLGGPQSQYIKDSTPATRPNVQVGTLRKSQAKDTRGPSSSVTSVQAKPQPHPLPQSFTAVRNLKFPGKASTSSTTPKFHCSKKFEIPKR